MTAIEPDVSKWDAWRPDEVVRLLEGCASRGTSLRAGRSTSSSAASRASTRISRSPCPNTRFDDVAEALESFEIFVITGRAEATPLADARDRLMDTHQTWMREPATGVVALRRFSRAVRRRHVDLQA